jgi:hypothetical protein
VCVGGSGWVALGGSIRNTLAVGSSGANHFGGPDTGSYIRDILHVIYNIHIEGDDVRDTGVWLLCAGARTDWSHL